MASTVTVRDLNEEIIRSCMKGRGEVSKSGIASLTGLSFPTVSRTIDHLAEIGEVEAVGPGSSNGGRCAILYRLNPLYTVSLLMTVERGRIEWKVRNLDGNTLTREETEAGGKLLSAIEEIARSVQALYPQLGAMVIGAAGMISGGQVLFSEGDAELEGLDLESFFEDRLGIPVRATNDMNAAAAGRWSRLGWERGSCVCLYMGQNGMGAGVVLHGQLWQGAGDFAGELSFLPDMGHRIQPWREEFRASEMTDVYRRLIQTYAAILNPERIVLYRNPFLDGAVETLGRECRKYIPEYAMPVLELSDDFERDYELGMAEIALKISRRGRSQKRSDKEVV